MTILIVDDNEQNLYQLQVLLGGNGYEVASAANGAEALTMARQNPPDLIVSDILMPVMDGFSLCREWKKDERLKTIPFVFYTATYTDARDREFALSLGAERFIVKPEEPDTFIRTIREALEEVQHPPSEPVLLPIGELEAEETGHLKQYNEVLVRKLERKMQQLEQTNRALEQDNAERNQAEKAMIESEERFRLLFEQAADSILLLDIVPKGIPVIRDANSATFRLLGYARDELIGQPLSFMEPAPDVLKVVNERRANILSGIGTVFEASHRCKDGTIREFECSVAETQVGSKIFAISVERDITERKQAEVALARERDLLSNLITNIPDHIYFKDRLSRFTKVNVAHARWFGLSDPRDMVGKTDRDFFSAEHAEQAYADEQHIMSTGQPVVGLEEKETWPDGHVTWVSTTKVPIRNAAGQVVGLLGVSRDISQRKRAEENLRDNEARYRSLFENSIMGISQALPDGRLLHANRAYARMYGYPNPEEMIADVEHVGRQLYANPDDRTEVVRILSEKGVLDPTEIPVVRRDGSPFVVLMAAREVRDASGNLVCYQAEQVDITERKRVEKALIESEVRFRVLFEQAADSILLLDMVPDGIPVIRDANRATFRLLGYERDELIGQPLSFIEPAPDVAKAVAERRRNILSGTGTVFEVGRRCKDGTIREFECSAAETRIGSKTFAMSVERDITARKQAEARMAEQLDELRRWQDATLGREGRVLDLKKEVNELLARAGEPPRYPSALGEE